VKWPQKTDKHFEQKLFKQLKGFAACEEQAADPLALPWRSGC